jgi:electron transfer flavoprotein beta subunit
MKIVVALKQVPARDSALIPAASGRWIDENDLAFEINEPDAYALEAGLQFRDRHGGEVVAVSLGPARVAQSLREALAKGADRALHIEDDNPGRWDALGVAELLARAIAPEKPDLILTGLQSDDLGYGETGVLVAGRLGLPHASIVVEIEKLDGAVRVKREWESGWFEHVELPLPALVTIQSGTVKLRYATLLGIKRARTKELRRLTVAELGEPPAPTVEIARVYLPQKSRQTELLDGSPREAAAHLVERLRFVARVI